MNEAAQTYKKDLNEYTRIHSLKIIPQMLKEKAQWVLWRAEYLPEKDKVNKIPINPKNYRNASSTDAATWTSFDETVQALKPGCGIGFVLAADDGLIGIDIDGCINDEMIEPWAQAVIKGLNSYSEVSPSGTGIRIFVEADWPPGGNRKGQLEVYSQGRFLTITGNHLEGTPLTIERRQEALNALHERYFPSKQTAEAPPSATSSPIFLSDSTLIKIAQNSKQGPDFTRLLAGEWQNIYESQSQADQAFCNMLAFWTRKNPGQMDSIFRNSGLYRPKWDEIHGAQTYGEMTIKKAIDDTRNVFEPKNNARNDFAETFHEEVANKLTTIVANNRFLDTMADEALKALILSNNPPFLFNRNGELVKINLVQEKDRYNNVVTRPVIKLVGEASLRGYLARSANYVKTRSVNGEIKYLPTTPPLEVVRDVLSRDNWEGIPLLRGVVGAPVMRWDGSLYDDPGYDITTALYYSSENFKMLKIPTNPTSLDINQAVAILMDLLADFPFDSEASKANIMAAIITPVLRDQIEGAVPMLLIDKPSQGTGASLLSDLISIVATGKQSYMTTEPEGRQKEEEMRKRITALLMDSRPVVVIDNIEGTLQSPNLCALLTTTQWSDRILGRNDVIDLQNRTFWIATGNNIRLAGDLPRRCFKVRMDAQQARPWQRDTRNFRHPQLIHYIKDNRGGILAAIFTLARAWILAGRPEPKQAPIMGSFEEWREVIGGILELAGINGFLENLSELYSESEQNEGIECFLEACYREWGPRPMTTKQVKRAIEFTPELADLLPSWLDPEEKGFTRKLGNLFARKDGVYFSNGLKLEKSGQSDRALLWRITRSDQLVKFDSS